MLLESDAKRSMLSDVRDIEVTLDIVMGEMVRIELCKADERSIKKSKHVYIIHTDRHTYTEITHTHTHI